MNVDPEFIKAGLLMEATQAQQRIANDALLRLEHAMRNLEPAVRSTVSQALAQAVADATDQEFAQLRQETQRTAEALGRARTGLNWNLLLVACAMSVVTALVMLAGISLLSGAAALGIGGDQPGASTAVQGLRGDPQALAEFARRGLQVEVALCGNANETRRPCVRVENPRSGAQSGTQSTTYTGTLTDAKGQQRRVTYQLLPAK